ncbi:DUF302 domain-containing protein [Primorskyibacter sp. S87]|uniref:DUF302 domain-containing protein n=1 Tax=Primorskyibacter sp. S87 TaxID=3415126 RepID=UPI003C7AA3F7
MKQFLLAGILALAAQAAVAQDAVTYSVDQSFDDVEFGLESAIVDRGLVIDAVSHVGDMLERTRADVGSDVVLFKKANVYSFCSASLSRKVMEIDPMNIQYCPYGIFIAEMPDSPEKAIIGYRVMPDGPMKEVEAMLDEITRAAIGEE